MSRKVLTAGHSLAVTIPSDFVHNVGIKPGDSVSVSTNLSTAVMTVTFSNPSQLPLLSVKK
ncbi:MAG: hypothetical protein UX42_C0012G0006 [Microgenomates group bacterium GW2011_GWC1_46_20]|nr:MAG: hypothetical protein UX42_C0012G0006 [Microgenomates group bacterium GW2011_GWC1_46_20]